LHVFLIYIFAYSVFQHEINMKYLQNYVYLFSDGFLNIEEFDGICKGLFRNDRGIVYSLDTNTLEHIFNIFDTKKVSRI
jgi:hypothetical protein